MFSQVNVVYTNPPARPAAREPRVRSTSEPEAIVTAIVKAPINAYVPNVATQHHQSHSQSASALLPQLVPLEP